MTPPVQPFPIPVRAPAPPARRLARPAGPAGGQRRRPAGPQLPTFERPAAGGRELLEDALLALMLLVCFGSVVGFYSKIHELKQAPGWALVMYVPPILWAGAMAAGAVHRALRAALLAGPLLLFVLWAALSFQWSHQPGLSLRQGLLFCATFLVACAIAMSLTWDRIGRVLVLVFATQAVISAALAIGRPEWGVMREIYPGAWSGLWNFKQSFGVAMSMGLAVTLGWTLRRPHTRLVPLAPVLALFAVCIVQSEATTALVVSVVAGGVAVAVWVARRHPALAVLAVWGVAMAVTAIVAVFTVLAPVIFQLLGKAPTLTGRTDIWLALEGAMEARPVLGWGYQAFWTDTSLSSPVGAIEAAMDGFRPPDAHSTPRDIQLQLGPAGLVLAALLLGRAWWQGVSMAPRFDGMLVALPFLAVFTATCFTETLGLYPMDFMGLVLQVIVIKLAVSSADAAGLVRGTPRLD